MLKKIISIVVVLAGIAVMILGFTLSSAAVEAAPHTLPAQNFSYRAEEQEAPSSSYSVSSAAFGGDFYTYIYRATYKIVSELDDLLSSNAIAVRKLNDIDRAIETIVRAENALYSASLANIEATDAVNKSIVTLERSFVKAAGIIVIAIGVLISAIGLLALASAFGGGAPKARRAADAAANEQEPAANGPVQQYETPEYAPSYEPAQQYETPEYPLSYEPAPVTEVIDLEPEAAEEAVAVEEAPVVEEPEGSRPEAAEEAAAVEEAPVAEEPEAPRPEAAEEAAAVEEAPIAEEPEAPRPEADETVAPV